MVEVGFRNIGRRQTGVVTQEVQEVLPEAVIDNGEHLAVAYGNLVGLLPVVWYVLPSL